MKRNHLKNLIYAFVAAGCLAGGVYFSMMGTASGNFIQASVLPVLNSMNEDLATHDPADLAVSDVTLTKVSDPTPDFNYYKYNADLTVRNLGGTLVNAQVVIHGGDNQKSSFVRNTSKGFYLQKGDTYVIRGYEVLFNGNYNGGKITLTATPKDKLDFDLSNNSYTVNVFELSPKIESVGLGEILSDNSFLVNFDVKPDFNGYVFEGYTTRNFNFPEDELKYAEVSGNGHAYSYFRARNFGDVVLSDSWQKINILNKDRFAVKFTDNPFEDTEDHYLYIKATDPENGYYVVSNVIKFPSYSEISRGDFAKYFSDLTGSELKNDSLVYSDLNPGKSMTREEVLRIVMDNYLVNLANENTQRFEDVQDGDPLFPYVQTLYADGKVNNFGHYFNPTLPATKEFLQYLVKEYQNSQRSIISKNFL